MVPTHFCCGFNRHWHAAGCRCPHVMSSGRHIIWQVMPWVYPFHAHRAKLASFRFFGSHVHRYHLGIHLQKTHEVRQSAVTSVAILLFYWVVRLGFCCSNPMPSTKGSRAHNQLFVSKMGWWSLATHFPGGPAAFSADVKQNVYGQEYGECHTNFACRQAVVGSISFPASLKSLWLIEGPFSTKRLINLTSFGNLSGL